MRSDNGLGHEVGHEVGHYVGAGTERIRAGARLGAFGMPQVTHGGNLVSAGTWGTSQIGDPWVVEGTASSAQSPIYASTLPGHLAHLCMSDLMPNTVPGQRVGQRGGLVLLPSSCPSSWLGA